MEEQTNLSIEWEGELSEEEISEISSNLPSLQEGSVRLQTEKALGGLELIIYTIVIAMVTKTGEKIVDAVWSAIKALCTSSATKKPKKLILKAEWDNGEAKIVLPLDQEEQLKNRLVALSKLISAS